MGGNAIDLTEHYTVLTAASDGIASDSDVIIIQQLLEDAAILATKDAIMSVVEMRGYVRSCIER